MTVDHVGSRTRCWLAILAAGLLAGCGSTPQRWPQAFDLAAAQISAAPAMPEIVLDGAASKAGGVGQAALKGAGWGLAIGLLMAPVSAGGSMIGGIGAATVGAATVAGGASGTAVGAMTAENATEIQAKRELLTQASAARSDAQWMADELGQAARARSKAGPLAQWQILVSLAEVATEGSGRDNPFALRLSARLEIHRSDGAQPGSPLVFAATSSTRLTTDGWGADAAAPLHAALDECRRSIVAQVLGLQQGSAARP